MVRRVKFPEVFPGPEARFLEKRSLVLWSHNEEAYILDPASALEGAICPHQDRRVVAGR